MDLEVFTELGSTLTAVIGAAMTLATAVIAGKIGLRWYKGFSSRAS